MEPTSAPLIVDPTGKPARPLVDARCPQCGLGPERRVLVSGFGAPQYACGGCGHPAEDPTR